MLWRMYMNYNISVIRTRRYCYINAISENNNERIGKVCIDLKSEDSARYTVLNKPIAKIILVATNQSECGKGIAAALLNKTIETFKNYVLYLNVVPLRNDKDKNRLIEFYSKFGFKRYDKDICITTMIR